MPVVAFLVDMAASARRGQHAEQLRQCSQILRHHRIAMAQSEKHQVQAGKQQRLKYQRMSLASALQLPRQLAPPEDAKQ